MANPNRGFEWVFGMIEQLTKLNWLLIPLLASIATLIWIVKRLVIVCCGGPFLP